VNESSARRRSRTIRAAGPSYYVTSGDGAELLLLLGPFPAALAARTWVDTVEDTLLARGEIRTAVGVGVTRVIGTAGATRPGDLNSCLGLAG
jgi:hypothetical protein